MSQGRRPARDRLGYIDESDLDLVIVLDANLGGPLTRHLLERAGLSARGDVRAARSTLRCSGLRETDVEITWEGGALLVEDKVDASFTPGQPDSYRQEVAERTEQGRIVQAVLICPSRNRARYKAAAGDAFVYVTCEELAEKAEQSGDRLALGAALVLRAAEEQPPGRPAEPLALQWGEGYRAVLAGVASGQQVKLSRKIIQTMDAEWVKLGLPGLDNRFDGPWHWLPRGVISLYTNEDPVLGTLPASVTVVRGRTSWRLDHPVPVVTLAVPAAEQASAIAEAVRVALVMREWAQTPGATEKPSDSESPFGLDEPSARST